MNSKNQIAYFLSAAIVTSLVSIGLSATQAHADLDDEVVPYNPKTMQVENPEDDPKSLLALRNKQKYWVKAGAMLDYEYEEFGLIKIHGQMEQVEVGYRHPLSWRHQTPAWWSAHGTFSLGTLRYDGGQQNFGSGGTITTTPYSTNTNDWILDLQGLFGLELVDHPTTNAGVYGGVAVWNLSDKSQGAGSYQRNITYFYLPLGGEFVKKWGSFVWSTSGEINCFLMGIVQSDLSQTGSGLPDITTYQFLGYGGKFRTSAEIMLKSWSIFIEGSAQYWNIPDSTTQTETIQTQSGSESLTLVEPHNQTTIWSVDLGGRF